MIETGWNVDIISRDDVRERFMLGDYNSDKEWHIKNLCLHIVSLHLLEGHDVYYDATNTRRAERIWAAEELGHAASEVVCFHFPCSLEDAVKRRPEFPKGRIEWMHKNLVEEPPDELEGYRLVTIHDAEREGPS
jgi:hypothetical protein